MTETQTPNRQKKRDRKPGPFTDKYIKSLKPENEMYQVREARGFAIRILPSGVKTWYYIYKHQGKRRQLNLGNYPDISLEKAHDEYRKAVDRVKAGEDPVSPPPPPNPEPEALTVQALANLWIDWSQQHHSPKWANTLKLVLQKDVLPIYGQRMAADITRKEAKAILEDKAKTQGKPGQARNLLKALQGMYTWAVDDEGILDVTPFSSLRVARVIPSMKQKKRERYLTEPEIRVLWEAIDSGGGSDSTKRALKLIMITAQRPGEVTGMHSQEIQIGVGKHRCLECRRCGWWTIPDERRKGNKGGIHRVYLSHLAMQLIGGQDGFIFPGDNPELPITENSVAYHVRREVVSTGKLPYYGLMRFTPHDLRRTAATNIGKRGALPPEVERILGHTLGGVAGIYNLHEYDELKEKWLSSWGEYLDNITQG